MHILIVLLTLTITVTSCNSYKSNEYYINKLRTELNISYPHQFQVLVHEVSSFGDHQEKFRLKFITNDFEYILSQIDTSNMNSFDTLNIYIHQTGTYDNGTSVMFYVSDEIVQYVNFEE